MYSFKMKPILFNLEHLDDYQNLRDYFNFSIDYNNFINGKKDNGFELSKSNYWKEKITSLMNSDDFNINQYLLSISISLCGYYKTNENQIFHFFDNKNTIESDLDLLSYPMISFYYGYWIENNYDNWVKNIIDNSVEYAIFYNYLDVLILCKDIIGREILKYDKFKNENNLSDDLINVINLNFVVVSQNHLIYMYNNLVNSIENFENFIIKLENL